MSCHKNVTVSKFSFWNDPYFSFWENIVNMYDLFAAGMTPFEAFFGRSSSSPELSMSLNDIQQQAHKNSKKYEEPMVITNLARNPPATYQVGDRVNIRVKSKAARLKSNAKSLLQPRSEEATVITCKHATHKYKVQVLRQLYAVVHHLLFYLELTRSLVYFECVGTDTERKSTVGESG